ncbi:hypothetical protein FQA39_LY08445 [Lamprigera yunnana]|nr:hypothetical protein FQA39_LY08445 [Lamprigera yunnana]
MEENVIQGTDISTQVSQHSVGIQLHNKLKENGHYNIFIDAFTGRTVTNKMILVNSCRLAVALRNYGLKPSDVVGVFSENCVEYFDPILAALFVGLTVTTFSDHLTNNELPHVVNLSRPKIIFCSKNTVGTILKTKEKLKVQPLLLAFDTTEEIEGCQCSENFVLANISSTFDIGTFQPVDVDTKEHVAFILYSSGTTGLPKGVMLTHHNINTLISISSTIATSNEAIIGLLPFYHAYGLFAAVVRIITKSTVIVMKSFDPYVYLKTIQDYKIRHLAIVPSIAYFLAKNKLVDNYDLSGVQSIVSGGAPLSKSIEEELSKRLKISKIRQGYGLTEATAPVLIHREDRYKYGSCGFATPSTSVKIIDVKTGHTLGPMETGELCCRGPLVMKGYINDPKSTEDIIDKDGWLHTGDVAYYDNDNSFYIVDRLKELIKCKGYQVAPAELEALLLTHPEIVDAGVIGISDEKQGELPFALIVRQPNSKLTEKDVKQFVADKVASYKQLRGGVKFVKQIPRNPSDMLLYVTFRSGRDREIDPTAAESVSAGWGIYTPYLSQLAYYQSWLLRPELRYCSTSAPDASVQAACLSSGSSGPVSGLALPELAGDLAKCQTASLGISPPTTWPGRDDAIPRRGCAQNNNTTLSGWALRETRCGSVYLSDTFIYDSSTIDAFTGRTATNKTVLANSCRLAVALRNHGLKPSDVIGVLSENCVEYFDPILAALFVGLTVTTFSSHLTSDELPHVVNLSRPKIIFCSKNTIATILRAKEKLTVQPLLLIFDTTEDIEGCQSLENFALANISSPFAVDTFEPVDVDTKEDVAFILYSSGTSGLPKGVMLTNHNINTFISITSDPSVMHISNEVIIGLLPFYHAYGLFHALIRIITESTVIVMKSFDPYVYLKTIQDYKIRHLTVVPSIAYFLAKSKLVDDYDLSHVQSILCTSAPLSRLIEEELSKRLKIYKIRQGYGMTEATAAMVIHKADNHKYGSCGTAIPCTSVKIIDLKTGQALGPMKTGELCCRGPLVMKGYVNDPKSTADIIDKDGWLHTGDVAYYDNDNSFYIVDRLKELIKCKGHQVAPAELEALLLTHPEIVDAGVIGIPDEKHGELPFALIVRQPNSKLADKDVKKFVADKVAPYKQLHGGVKFVKQIPRNPIDFTEPSKQNSFSYSPQQQTFVTPENVKEILKGSTQWNTEAGPSWASDSPHLTFNTPTRTYSSATIPSMTLFISDNEKHGN